jgi:nicotinamide phosphoribosyltransferase
MVFAMKATYGEVNGVGRNIYKDPVTDDGTKKSLKGLLRVDEVNGTLVAKDECTLEEEKGGLQTEIFLDGKFLIKTTLKEVRNKIENG